MSIATNVSKSRHYLSQYSRCINEKTRVFRVEAFSRPCYLKALLGVYEKNDVSLFRDLFLWAYKRSTQRYSAIQQSLGEPNLIKLKYRTQIHEIIKKIVLSKVPRKLLTLTILKSIKAFKLPSADAKKLFDLIEVEFDSLHEGNIARYQIKLSEFKAWSAKK